MKNDVHHEDNQGRKNGNPLSEIQLTTFALGELPEKERKEVELLLKSDEGQRAEFEEIRSTAAVLSTELKSESLPALTEEEKQRIRETVGSAPRFPEIKKPSRVVQIGRYAAFGAIAACLAVATVSLLDLNTDGRLAQDEKGLSEESFVAREKQQALMRVASLTAQVAEQEGKIAAARTAMLDKMEELKISDLDAESPTWMRGDSETGSPVELVKTTRREYDRRIAVKETLEAQLVVARQSLAAAELASDQLIASNGESAYLQEEMGFDSASGREKSASVMQPSIAPAEMPQMESGRGYAGKQIAKNEEAAHVDPSSADAYKAPANMKKLKLAPADGKSLTPEGNSLRSGGIEASQKPDNPQTAPIAGSAGSITTVGKKSAAKDSMRPVPNAAPFAMDEAESSPEPPVIVTGVPAESAARSNISSTRGSTVSAPATPKPMVPLPDDLISDESVRYRIADSEVSSPDEVDAAPAFGDQGQRITRDSAAKELADLTRTIKAVTGTMEDLQSGDAPDISSLPSQKQKELAKSFGIDAERFGGRLALEGEEMDKVVAGVVQMGRRKKELEDFLRRPPALDPSNEDYGKLVDNPWISSWDENFSTFSIDVDTASYSNVRRFISNRNQMPPKDAVRIEEMINYFDYEYPQPEGTHPFAVTTEVAGCPWAPGHRLVRIGLKGKEMHLNERPPMNLVFLIDVSGSMDSQSKLPLLKTSMKHLVDELSPRDRVAMVVYAGKAGLVLDATTGDRKDEIKGALEKLQSGGSTAGGAGIQLAYKIAKLNHIEGGVNRVILATDGDFNVGDTDTGNLTTMVANRAKSDDTFLTILGFGEGNLKESRMEQIANKGNGNYYYIDNEKEGRRVLVDKLSATLVTIAKDVKIQVDFNPGKVGYYRLIGYANRLLDKRDFDDDRKDAGEIGAGHTVTALYEIVPAGVELQKPHGANPTSRYLAGDENPSEKNERRKAKNLIKSPEMLTVKLRYKQPEGTESTLLEVPLEDLGRDWAQSSEDFRFAAAVAGYGMMLRDSAHRGTLRYDQVLELAVEGSRQESDPHGLRAEFIEMVKTTKRITGR